MTEPARRKPLLCAGLLAFALLVAWFRRFVQDDAFISFIYARNLAEGHGLVYSLGERVEGYTNFLWTLCIAPAFRLGVDPVAWSWGLSLASFAATLGAVAWLARRRLESERARILAFLLLALNFSFSSYATGGLETQFGIAWIMLSIALLEAGKALPAALCAACAVMTRMDSALLLGPFWLAAFLRKDGAQLRRMAAFAAGCAAPVAAWLIWRRAYYGAWLPNTFLIKGQLSPLRGLWYVALFYLGYGWWLALPAAWQARGKLASLKPQSGWGAALVALALWHLYIVCVGGDFMEFRFLMPSLPLVALATARLFELSAERRRTLAAVAVLLMLLLANFGGMRFLNCRGVENIAALKANVSEWQALADSLSGFFGDDRGAVKIGVSAAGVIPYATRMPTLDLLGLNSREVAMNGEALPAQRFFGNRPGHFKIATWEQVKAANVDLLLNHPWVVASADAPELAWPARRIIAEWGPFVHVRLPASAAAAETPPVIAWPLPDGRFWLTVYMRRNPAVDAAIARAGARALR